MTPPSAAHGNVPTDDGPGGNDGRRYDGHVGAPDEYTFVIADLAGYTALTEAHGGAEAARTIARYTELASNALTPGVRLTERVGDQVLIVGDDPSSAVTTRTVFSPCFA